MALVEYEKTGTFLSDTENIAKITLNRPDKLNTFNPDILDEFEAALDKAEEDNDVRAVIITGTGKAFSAGADIQTASQLEAADYKEFVERGTNVFQRVAEFPKGTIAALNGLALGGGLELACACDIRVASDEIKIGFPEVSLGLIPGWGGIQRVPELIGRSKANEMILTGNQFSAEDAPAGLLNKIVPSDELESTASFLASKIADNAPIAVKYAKESLNKVRSMSMEEGLQSDVEYLLKLAETEDLEEGISAMMAKRKPEFKGK